MAEVEVDVVVGDDAGEALGDPAKLVAKVKGLQTKIKSGNLRVDIDEAQPPGSVAVK